MSKNTVYMKKNRVGTVALVKEHLGGGFTTLQLVNAVTGVVIKGQDDDGNPIKYRTLQQADDVMNFWYDELTSVGWAQVDENGHPTERITLGRAFRGTLQMATRQGATPAKLPRAIEAISGEQVSFAKRAAIVRYTTVVKENLPLNKPHDRMDAVANAETAQLLVLACAEL